MSQQEEINIFFRSFNKASEEIIRKIDESVSSASKELAALIIDATPVGNPALWKWKPPAGYTPGQLKAAWQIKDEESGYNKVVTIYNETVYAERIEYGSWSTQAPAGMMRVSAISFPSILDTKLKENGLI